MAIKLIILALALLIEPCFAKPDQREDAWNYFLNLTDPNRSSSNELVQLDPNVLPPQENTVLPNLFMYIPFNTGSHSIQLRLPLNASVEDVVTALTAYMENIISSYIKWASFNTTMGNFASQMHEEKVQTRKILSDTRKNRIDLSKRLQSGEININDDDFPIPSFEYSPPSIPEEGANFTIPDLTGLTADEKKQRLLQSIDEAMTFFDSHIRPAIDYSERNRRDHLKFIEDLSKTILEERKKYLKEAETFIYELQQKQTQNN